MRWVKVAICLYVGLLWLTILLLAAMGRFV